MIVLAAAMLLAAVSRADPAPMHAWRSLLDENAAAWRGWKATTFPEGWQVAADTISKEGEVDDLVTREMFGDFVFEHLLNTAVQEQTIFDNTCITDWELGRYFERG